jgi:hypothetical protein
MSPTEVISTRAMSPEDEPFLRRVYAGTREEELAVVPWSIDQKDAFLRMQFDAQHRYYQDQFPDASFDVVLRKTCQSVDSTSIDATTRSGSSTSP